MIKRLKALRLRVEFGMWLGVAIAAYAFALALWRVLGLPGMAAGALEWAFSAVWLLLIACLALIPRSRPDEMSAAAFARASKYSGRLLFASMWVLLVMLSPFMDGWFEGFTRSLWNLMAFVSGALLAAYLCRVLVFIYFDRRGSEDD